MEPGSRRSVFNKLPLHPGSLTYEENGRHYLIHSPHYMFPCDSVEANRMDLFHKAVSIARGRPGQIHSAPLRPDEHLRILDLGTGTGLWVVEMADLYAGRSEVWGVDLAPFQPDLIPSNAKFQRLDVESPWHGLGAASWDLIHVRCLNGAVRDWAALYAVIRHHLIRGVGHIEHVEIDWAPQWPAAGPTPPHLAADEQRRGGGPAGAAHLGVRHSHLAAWAHILLDCMDRAGRPMRVDAAATRAALREAGFVDVQQEAYRLPFGRGQEASSPDAADGGAESAGAGGARQREAVGRWFPLAFDLWLEGLTLAPLSRVGGYGAEAIYRLLEDVRREVADPATQASCTLYVWTAKRP